MASVACVLLSANACTSLPPLSGNENLAIDATRAWLTPPHVMIQGESSLAPGRAAVAGFEVSQACGYFAPICAIVTVPAGAIVGATAKASQKLPRAQALSLNQVTLEVLQPAAVNAAFEDALNAEGRRRGIRLGVGNPDRRVEIHSTSLDWDTGIGNRVAIRMKIAFAVTGTDTRRSRPITIRSESAKVSAWIADDGALIEAALQATLAAASRRIWKELLGAERQNT